MKLINAILRPGKVLEVIENGKIKAAAQGLFSDKEETSKLPPVYPFVNLIGGHENSFSTPMVDDDIWVLNCTDNPLQLYWFRRDNIHNLDSLFEESGKENVEVICHREASNGWATLYFSDGSGWVLRNNETKINLTKNGNIELTNPNQSIILDSTVHLGGTSGEQPAVLGDELVSNLQSIANTFSATAAVCTTPYLSPLKGPLDSGAQILNSMIQKILSKNVKLN